MLLTPLATAAFSSTSIERIAERTGTSIGGWCNIINASSAGGGHSAFKWHYCSCCSYECNKELGRPKLGRINSVEGIVKQYTSAGKPFEDELIEAAMAACQGLTQLAQQEEEVSVGSVAVVTTGVDHGDDVAMF